MHMNAIYECRLTHQSPQSTGPKLSPTTDFLQSISLQCMCKFQLNLWIIISIRFILIFAFKTIVSLENLNSHLIQLKIFIALVCYLLRQNFMSWFLPRKNCLSFFFCFAINMCSLFCFCSTSVFCELFLVHNSYWGQENYNHTLQNITILSTFSHTIRAYQPLQCFFFTVVIVVVWN